MGNITINSNITGGGGGGTGDVSGGSNLTTVGAIPYVSASGVLNQDPTALFWDAANNRLGVVSINDPTTNNAINLGLWPNGTATQSTLTLYNNSAGGSAQYAQFTIVGPGSNSETRILTGANTGTAGDIVISPGGTERVRFVRSTGNLLIGTTTDSGYKLEAYTATDTRVVATANVTRVAIFANNSTSTGYVGTLSASPLSFRVNDSDMARFATTGNLLIGTTTDSNFKLDVAASGSAGTARFYGGSGVSNSTKVVVQAGGGQSGNLQEWQNSAGTALARILSDGSFLNAGSLTSGYSVSTGASVQFSNSTTEIFNVAYLNGSRVGLGSGTTLGWTASASAYAALDTSLSRASSGVLQVGDGGSNANGYLSAARIGAGTASPTTTLHASSNGASLTWGFTGGFNSRLLITDTGGTPRFQFGVQEFSYLANVGNVGIGTTTDSNFKLDVASSGSSGTLRVYDQTATTGVTKAVIRAGAGQSTTNLTEWQNSGGTTVLLSIGPGGVISAQGNVLGITNTSVSTIQLGSTYGLGWSSTGTYGGAKDVAITRNAAGVIEVNNGTAGTYRDLILRRSQHNGVTVADLPAAAAGNAGSIQYVTDANATTIGSTVAGGGANKVMVWSDGAAWKIFAS